MLKKFKSLVFILCLAALVILTLWLSMMTLAGAERRGDRVRELSSRVMERLESETNYLDQEAGVEQKDYHDILLQLWGNEDEHDDDEDPEED